eukprot:TRINITY_DN21749_c0_g1_i1.p1 TRINITY_DN21749_c0_g1~~TRINITY_DN21749_c0_g1_i1.p1  ORF type:complete len:245 (+),score=42.52 TRINITY_DN21749_c0_g1_i1:74-808(+)
MSAQQHYETHLAKFYSWSSGDFETQQESFKKFLVDNDITAKGSVLDLGAGHGVQCGVLTKMGFKVTAVDFNMELLKELKENCTGNETIEVVHGDIRSAVKDSKQKFDLIICWGDTLTHLDDKHDIEEFLKGCAGCLAPGGKLLLSFRNYTENMLQGPNRFIPVRQSDNKIHTCFVDYVTETTVEITDLFHERPDGSSSWQQSASSYKKVRISPAEVSQILTDLGLTILASDVVNRSQTFVAVSK